MTRPALLADTCFWAQPAHFQQFFFSKIAIQEGLAHGVLFDVEKKSLYCTCPFQPKPCVHAQALALLYESAGEGIFSTSDILPEWASALLEGLHAGKLRSSAAADQARETSRNRRRLERLERAAHGFEDVETWLLDLARRGLATAVSEEKDFYLLAAARTADASMSGLSRSFRLLGQIPTSEPDWAERTLAVLADAYLAVRAFQQRDALPEALLYDLQAFIGIAMKKEEVLTIGEKIHDTWTVLAQSEEPVEDRLTARRTWLYGAQSTRFGLLLEYAFGKEGFPMGLLPGSSWQGDLAFYPSAWPQRVLVMNDLKSTPEPIEKRIGVTDFEVLGQTWAEATGRQPWLTVLPIILQNVTPFVEKGCFFLADVGGKTLSLEQREEMGWRLLALSGGIPLTVFGEWNGSVLRVLSAVAEGRFVTI